MQPDAFPIKASSLHKLPKGWTSHCIIFVKKRKLQSIKHDIRFSIRYQYYLAQIVLPSFVWTSNACVVHIEFILSASTFVRDSESGFNQTVNALKVLRNMVLLKIILIFFLATTGHKIYLLYRWICFNGIHQNNKNLQ